MSGESNREADTYVTRQPMGICLTTQLREPKPGLCNNLEGWERVGGGRELQEGGGICTCMPLSHFRRV